MAEADDGTGDAAPGWYVGAFALYVGLGYVFKTVFLNWIVGPLFLLVVLYLVPRAFGRRR